jgi:inner membrane transporter RhtA
MAADPAQDPAEVPASAAERSVLAGVAAILASGAANQVGAGLGAHAFPAIGPAGVVAVRQVVAALVLVPVARPPVRSMTAAQWRPTLALAAVFAVMNLSLYTAIDRIGLGLAVTLEFLGPLGVALVAARSRGHALTALVAAAGVWVLVRPGPASDPLGVGLAVLAAGGWAAYILLNRVLGRRLPGLQAPAVATSASALLYLPVLLVLLAQGRFDQAALGAAVAAGVLSSVVPYAADLTALRRVPARAFGVLMSAQPVWAALSGLLLLGEVLTASQWAGIGAIVAANVLTVAAAGAGAGAAPRTGSTPPTADGSQGERAELREPVAVEATAAAASGAGGQIPA